MIKLYGLTRDLTYNDRWILTVLSNLGIKIDEKCDGRVGLYHIGNSTILYDNWDVLDSPKIGIISRNETTLKHDLEDILHALKNNKPKNFDLYVYERDTKKEIRGFSIFDE